MEIIPAIDLKSGKCVRLLQGREENATEYSDDPVAVAAEWVRQGARRLHIVNLDGAFGRSSENLDVLSRIAEQVRAVIQFGGGLRTLEDVEDAMSRGPDKIVLGTSVVENPALVETVLGKFGSERVITAIDGLHGKVATHGWRTISDVAVIDLAHTMRDLGVKEMLYTDITRDGMMTGPDCSTMTKLGAIGIDVLASGGISTADDVRALLALGQPRITGVIIGRALYEKRIDLGTLIKEVSPC
jgi:phosphoribosylformimino-5-aminoimidazole carboxamide ribotide isomerase